MGLEGARLIPSIFILHCYEVEYGRFNSKSLDCMLELRHRGIINYVCTMIKTTLEVLKAGCGDCIFITIKYNKKSFHILIDGGVSATYLDFKCGYPKSGELKNKIECLKNANEHIDLLVITHIDDDHIGGIINWFSHDFPDKSFVKEVWFNDNVAIPQFQSTNDSKETAIDLKTLLDKQGIPYKNKIVQNQQYRYDWGKICILSPNAKYHNKVAKILQETLDRRTTDNSGNDSYLKSIDDLMICKWKSQLSDANKASIAFLLSTCDDHNYLMLGDTAINVLISGLKNLGYGKNHKLECETIKLSHHGSKNNYKDKFLDFVSTKQFVVSTDGTSYGHPDKEVIAHLITKTNSDILFNYDDVLKRLFTKEDLASYPQILQRCKMCQ